MKKPNALLRDRFTVGLAASAIVHAALITLLLMNWDFDQNEPQAEEAVSVEIVPPPEETAAVEPEPEPEPEPQPEPEAEPEPEPEQQAAEEPPPPPPPETSEETAEQTAPTAEVEAPQAPAPNVFEPVYEFGEESGGPKVAPEGNAATGEEKTGEPGLAEERIDEGEPTPLAQDDPAPPETLLTAKESDAGIEAIIEADLTDREKTDQTETAPQEQPDEAEELQEARTIFSQTDNSVAAAVTAMNGLSRAARGGKLCGTELREQLLHQNPDLRLVGFINYAFPKGNVMAVNKGAFRTADGWQNVKYRCEINDEGTRITSFSFQVGGPIPRAQWKERGLPEN